MNCEYLHSGTKLSGWLRYCVQVHFSVSLCLQLPCDVAQTHSELTVDILNVSLDSTESYLDEQYLTSEIISLTSFSFGVCLPPERVILFVGISWENSANLLSQYSTKLALTLLRFPASCNNFSFTASIDEVQLSSPCLE